MNDLRQTVADLLDYTEEQEWFEFKGSWYEPQALGEYVSALSNAAAETGHEFGFMIWGIDNDTHKITGTTFNYRREILSFGKLAPKQTVKGFFAGESVPVNQGLSDIFLQLHISERSGRGVPEITKVYGKKTFEFRDNAIVATIPFTETMSLPDTTADVGNKVGDKVGNKVGGNQLDSLLNDTQRMVLRAMRDNSFITKVNLVGVAGVTKTAIDRAIDALKRLGYVRRVGARKNGHWEVLK